MRDGNIRIQRQADTRDAKEMRELWKLCFGCHQGAHSTKLGHQLQSLAVAKLFVFFLICGLKTTTVESLGNFC